MRTLPAAAVLVVVALAPLAFAEPAAPPTTLLFCFWNVENLFDDRDDNQPSEADRVYDRWFAKDGKALRQKMENLAKAIAKLNGGKGPDLLALAEVENQRAVEMLRDAIQQELGKSGLEYKHVAYLSPGGGRVIGNAVLSRVPLEMRKTTLLGDRLRILEVHPVLDGHDLTLIASHWTARISDGTGESRQRYAQRIHERYQHLRKKNADVDLLVCGDFNDNPTDESVSQTLWATDDRELVKKPNTAHLFNPFLGRFRSKEADRVGTLSYQGKWHTFDQVVVSAGMLDGNGWGCEPEKMTAVQNLTADDKGRPLRFGDERFGGKRGWSDHFPVTIPLRVQAK